MSRAGPLPTTVLIVSFQYWPALNARAFRWTALAEHWASEGRAVHVVCARLPDRPVFEMINGVRIHRVGNAWIERRRAAGVRLSGGGAAAGRDGVRRKILAAMRALWRGIYWPDTSCTWYFAAHNKARELMDTTSPQALISVSPAFTAVAVGRSLARRRPCEFRWLIDLGDPFSFAVEAPPNNFFLYRRLNTRFERACFAAADSISVTTPETRERYAALFPESATKITVIPPLASPPAAGPAYAGSSARRKLTFLGRLYPTIRRPDFLLSLFAALSESPGGERYELHFYGDTWECEASFAPFGHMLGRSIFLHGTVSRELAAAAMRAADVLVNIGNDTRYQLPSKIVEYAMTGRPILNVVHQADDSSAKFLATHPAHLTLAAREGGATREDISRLLAFLGRDTGKIPEGALRAWLAPYTLPEISTRYDELLSGEASSRSTGVRPT